MSEENQENTENKTEEVVAEETTPANTDLKLETVFAFKEGMSSYIDDKGDMVAATIVRYEPWVVSQVKTEENDGYTAVQLSCRPTKASRARKSKTAHAKKAGFENGAAFSREVRGDVPEGASIGQKLDLNSIAAGDVVKVTGLTKGRGFTGVVKRFNFSGGPQTHGSGFGRVPGGSSAGTRPGRIRKGFSHPGHYGVETVTTRAKVLEVLPEEQAVILHGPVPGAKQTLLRITKV